MWSAPYWNLFIRKNHFPALWRELDEFGSIAPAEARRRLGERLLAQIRYFGNRSDALPEWREAAAARTSEELWRIWPALPILSKRDLETRFHPREMAERFGLKGKLNATGGSTGEPTHFFHSQEMIEVSAATSVYCRMRLGWQPGMATIAIWGSDRDIGKLQQHLRDRIITRLRNDWIIGGFGLNRGTTDQVLDLIRRHGPVAMYGYSSILEFLARQVLDSGDLPARGAVQAAWNGGEMLFDSQSELFEKAFGVPILNWYGGRELSVMAYQPQRGGPLRALRPFLMVEVVDEQGKPVGPGQTGRLVWTSTACRGTPFLRYDIGDLGTYASEEQDESGIRALRELQGRNSGLLRLPNGNTINCIFWNHLLKEFPEVHQFQVALLQDREIQFRLKGEAFAPEREAHLRHVLGDFMPEVPVTIRWVEQIPLTREGKLVQVVREN